MDIDNLDIYFEDCVIGGPGAFVIPIRERDQFKEAIRTKLVLEIAGRTPRARVIPVQARAAAHLLHHRRADVARPLGRIETALLLEPRHDLHMRRIAELVDRRDARQPVAAVDQDAGVAREGRGIARHRDHDRHG